MLMDPLCTMTTEELVAALQTFGAPIMAELLRRGLRLRLEQRASFEVPVFVVAPVPKAVSE